LNCSPLGLVPKNVPRKFRLIHDLSYPKHFSVNAGISQENSWVQYEGISKVIDLVKSFGRQCLLAKCDIEDAFRIINIHPSDHHLLDLTWNIFYYFDRCLPWELAVHVRSLNHFLVPCNGFFAEIFSSCAVLCIANYLFFEFFEFFEFYLNGINFDTVNCNNCGTFVGKTVFWDIPSALYENCNHLFVY
jgi:hypothetical protein